MCGYWGTGIKAADVHDSPRKCRESRGSVILCRSRECSSQMDLQRETKRATDTSTVWGGSGYKSGRENSMHIILASEPDTRQMNSDVGFGIFRV